MVSVKNMDFNFNIGEIVVLCFFIFFCFLIKSYLYIVDNLIYMTLTLKKRKKEISRRSKSRRKLRRKAYRNRRGMGVKQTGGGVLNEVEFKRKCQAVMNILLEHYPRFGGLSGSSGSEGEFREALTNFLAAYGFSGQMDDLLTYAEECIRNFAGGGAGGVSGGVSVSGGDKSNSGKQKSLMYLKSHSEFSNPFLSEYVRLPKNVSVCFLTGINKYSEFNLLDRGESEFATELFTGKYTEDRRKAFFDSIFRCHQNYFDAVPFECRKMESGKLGLDYFREATWFYGGMLCSNSIFSMSVEEYQNKKLFGIQEINRDSKYLAGDANSYLDSYFGGLGGGGGKKKWTVNLENLLTSGIFQGTKQYLLVIPGCRMLDFRFPYFQKQIQFNFIHHQLTYQLCRKMVGGTGLGCEPIPELFTALRPREVLVDFSLDITRAPDLEGNLEVMRNLKRSYNLFSSQNHLIDDIVEKLRGSSGGGGGGGGDLVDNVGRWVQTLNYDKILALAKLVGARGISDKIFTAEVVEYKIDDLFLLARMLVGEGLGLGGLGSGLAELGSLEVDVGLELEVDSQELDQRMLISLASQFSFYLEFIDLVGMEDVWSKFSLYAPKLIGVSYLTSNLFLQKGRKLYKLIRDNRKECIMFNVTGEQKKIEKVVSDFMRIRSVRLLSCYRCELTNSFVAGWHSLSNLKVLRLTRCLGGDGFNGKLDLPYGLEKLELEIDVSLSQKHLVLDVSNLKTLIINSSLDCLTLEKLIVVGLEKLEEIHLQNINVYDTPGLHLGRMLGVKKLVLDSVLLVDEGGGVEGGGLPNLEVLELKSIMDEDIAFLKECWTLSPNLKRVCRDSEIIVGKLI